MTEPVSFDNVDDVKIAYSEGDIERAESIQVLMEEFDFSEEDAIILVDSWAEPEEA